MLESLQTESSDVQSFFESMNLNSTAFAELGTVMGGLGGDEAELQDYFQLLFTSSEATALLVASVGSDGAAQQAVTDALDGNTEVRAGLEAVCVCGCSVLILIVLDSSLLYGPNHLEGELRAERRGGEDKQSSPTNK